MDFPVRKYKEYVVLFSIFLVALALRLTTAKYDLLLGADSWYHYKISRQILETGFYPYFDYDIYYPSGTVTSHLIGLYFLPVYLFRVMSFTGISLFTVFQLIPPLLGSGSVLFLYLLSREVYGRRTAFIATLLFSISPAGIDRALAGYYRGDVLMSFTMLLVFYLFYRYIKRGGYWPLVVGAGGFFFCGMFWNGWPFVMTVLTLALLFYVLTGYLYQRDSSRVITSYAVICGIGVFTIYIQRLNQYAYTGALPGIARESAVVFKMLFVVIGLALVLEGLNRSLVQKSLSTRIGVLSFILLVAGAALYKAYGQVAYGIPPWAFDLYEFGTRTVSEQQLISLQYLRTIFGPLLLLFPVGFYFLLKDRRDIFILSFFVAAVLISASQIRFLFLAAPVMAILGALALERVKSRVFILLAVFLVAANGAAASEYALSIEPFVSDELVDALIWIKYNTSEDSAVLSWWDHTGPIVAIADRKTVLITTTYKGRSTELATALSTSNVTKSLEIMESTRADYLLIDKRIFEMAPVITDVYSEEKNPFLSESVLYRVYKLDDVPGVTKVYDNGNAKVYALEYNFTKVSTLNADRYYYQPGGKMQISVRVRSNELKEMVLKMENNAGAVVTRPIQEGEFVTIEVEAPLEGGKEYYFTVYVFDTDMQKRYASLQRHFAVTDELIRVDFRRVGDEFW